MDTVVTTRTRDDRRWVQVSILNVRLSPQSLLVQDRIPGPPPITHITARLHLTPALLSKWCTDGPSSGRAGTAGRLPGSPQPNTFSVRSAGMLYSRIVNLHPEGSGNLVRTRPLSVRVETVRCPNLSGTPWLYREIRVRPHGEAGAQPPLRKSVLIREQAESRFTVVGG